ncbi:hypothetical protein D3C87_1826750 [compost metagenome]
MTHYIPENNTYVYFRYNDAKTVMVVFNNNVKAQTVKTSRFKENIKTFKSGKDVITGKTFDLATEINLEPKSAVILELE